MQRKRLRLWGLPRISSGSFLTVAGALFVLGLLAGYLLSCRVQGTAEYAMLSAAASAPLTPARFLRVFWSGFRWLLAAGLLSLSALGLFLLYPLLFLRGVFLGFSFSALFLAGSRLEVLLHFLLVALLTCSPLLLLTAAGMSLGMREVSGSRTAEGDISPTVIPLLLLLALALTLLCCLTELWLLPGFVFDI